MYGSKSSKIYLLQEREERRLKTKLETINIVENQIEEEFFIDFTVPLYLCSAVRALKINLVVCTLLYDF